MNTACRDLNNYQWRLVANAIAKCSLPIFVKLVFAEICRWRSYTRPQETHLASTVMDSIMMLFERIEKQVKLNAMLERPVSGSILKHKSTPSTAAFSSSMRSPTSRPPSPACPRANWRT